MNNILEINNLSKKYHTLEGEIDAIKDFSLELKEGEIVSILGPSGCGKSTILSIISSLDNDYSGSINLKKNSLGYMMQSDALFPWLTIYENACLGLKITNNINKDNLNYIDNLLKLYNLYEFKDKYPKSLSGGMKQRVALLRTLAIKPDILLLDEPFSALDSQTRLVISNDLYKILKKEKKSCILVTHNIEEALLFSDRIIILSKRPAIVKKTLDINLSYKDNIFEKRKDESFNKYYDLIWKEVDYLE